MYMHAPLKDAPVKAVLFDWEETLMDVRATREAFLVVQWQSFLDELLHIPAKQYVETVMRSLDTSPPPAAYGKACRELNLPPALAEAFAQDYHRQHGGTPRLFTGALNLMRHLSAIYQTGLICNGSAAHVNQALREAGIAPYLQYVRVSEPTGAAKPGAEIFHRALQDLGLAAAQAVYVGDDPVLDIQAAVHAGLHAVWKRPPGNPLRHPPHADGVIDDIRDLPHALRDLAGIPAG